MMRHQKARFIHFSESDQNEKDDRAQQHKEELKLFDHEVCEKIDQQLFVGLFSKSKDKKHSYLVTHSTEKPTSTNVLKIKPLEQFTPK